MDLSIYLFILFFSIFVNLFFGFFIFSKNNSSFSAKALLIFCIINSIWSLFSYAGFFWQKEGTVLYILRSIIFLATLQGLSIYMLVRSFPEERYLPTSFEKFFIIPLVLITSFLCFTSLFFSSIHISNGIYQPDVGVLIPFFGIVSISMVVLSIYNLFRKIKENPYKKSFKFLLLGISIMFTAVVIFNFLLPVVFKLPGFVALAPLFTLPFVLLAFYGILREKTFDVNTIATEILVYLYWALSFLFIFIVSGVLQKVFISLFFLGSLYLGQKIVNSVRKEVEEKERVLKLNTKVEKQNKLIESQKKTLSELLKMKDETLHIVNHQINTPLSIIRSGIDMFKEGMWEKDKFVEVLEKEALRMKDTIAVFLAAKKAEDGKIDIKKSQIDFITLVESVIEEKKLMKKVRESNIKINFKHNVDYLNINVDLPKIKEVISNLIDNAINYSSKDIDISVTKSESKFIFSVSDSGIGIAPENIDKLFARFTRLANAQKTKPDGTGLGIYVCKQIIEAHKGKIWVKSDGEGKGSEFSFELSVLS